MVLRQAVAGLMWGKQFYHCDVARWLSGDPHGIPSPPSRQRNRHWWHMSSFDVISMPDPWEYPWYAAWDLAFQCVAIARVDPGFAKQQLLLLLKEWYMHPNGQLPAYEWALEDVNPPVHGWAALRVFELDGARDFDFLERVLHKLLMNFTWWVNRKDSGGNNVFEGGFLGLGQRGAVRPRRGAAGGGSAGAERRHRLDGHVRAQHARDEHRARHPQPVLCGPRDEVPRALRLHRRSRLRAGAVGRRRRLLLRRHPAGRRREGATEGTLGGRPAAARGDDDPLVGDAQPAAGGGRATALVPHQPAGVRRRARRPPDPQRPAAPTALRGGAGPTDADPGPDARPGRVPFAVRAAHALARPPRTSRSP